MEKSIIYQIFPRYWGDRAGKQKKGGTLDENGCGKFSNIDRESLDYFKSLGVTHLWLTGIVRHATGESTGGCTASSPDWVKGRAGSPYAITDYYDVNPYLADKPERRMEEFKELLKRVHNAGLKVIIDFVPNHVARDYTSFTALHPAPTGMPSLGSDDDKSVHWREENDFFYYPGTELKLPIKSQTYKELPALASGNAYTAEPAVNDWYDTVKINYCDTHTGTWDKMLDIVRFWAGMGVDGFRCDMVELVPADFFTWLIREIHKQYPEIVFIAEVYQKELYSKYIREVGFDLLYDKSGMYDTIRAIVQKNTDDSGVPVEAWQSTRKITWNWQSLGDLQPYMLNFLENHDEQRFASDFFGKDAGNVFAALYASLYFNRAPFMIYSGQEVGERGMYQEGFSGKDGRSTIFDWYTSDKVRKLWRYIHGDMKALDRKDVALLERYRSALTQATGNRAVISGSTYDLCYCNLSSDGFCVDRHFAFLRDCGDDTVLVACNFSNVDAEMELSIPEHAFQWLELNETETLNHNKPIRLKVPAMDATVVKLS
ncbi:MAG: alpha-amylase family glycosyl hydrolase [Candidatus Cryptobacteroides sp.]|nr:alpha-amylase family glycosyl hydrolase [Candidatus Cryptobacteroides sp.]